MRAALRYQIGNSNPATPLQEPSQTRLPCLPYQGMRQPLLSAAMARRRFKSTMGCRALGANARGLAIRTAEMKAAASGGGHLVAIAFGIRC
jgi:hypothetical protein